MTKTKGIRIPVSPQEKEELVKKSLKAGYRSLSEYLRDKGLEREKQDK